MTRLASAGIFLTGLAAALALLPTTAAAVTTVPCSSPGSVTVIRTARVRIFDKHHVRYGCDKRARRRIRLGRSGLGLQNPTGKTVIDMRVAGFFVAYTLSEEPSSSKGPFGTADVRWVDLRHGQRISPATGCDRRFEVSDGNVVRSLVLSTTGAMAWACNDFAASELHKLDRNGAALLDSFAGQSDMSLALSESNGVVLYWTNLDGPHSARLVGF